MHDTLTTIKFRTLKTIIAKTMYSLFTKYKITFASLVMCNLQFRDKYDTNATTLSRFISVFRRIIRFVDFEEGVVGRKRFCVYFYDNGADRSEQE